MLKTLANWLNNRTVKKPPLRSDINGSHPVITEGHAGELEPIEESTSQLVLYDENLLERSRTQWEFGDWDSLAKIERGALQHHPDRAKLALLAAAGHQQIGDMSATRQFTRLAQDWGCSKKLISQILIAGAYNTLGRAATVAGDQRRALKHFETAIDTGAPGGDLRLVTQARTTEQITQIFRIDSQLKQKSVYLELSDKEEDNHPIIDSSQLSLSPNQPYDTAFYDAQKAGSELSAKEVLSLVFQAFKPESMIDIGCGTGTWVKIAKELGIKRTLGVDGEYAINSLVIPRNEFLFRDLNSPLSDLGRFELAISLEVAEHLDVDRADAFVRDLCKLSNIILFSAAIPYQGGTDHRNENWPEYWAEKFLAHGFATLDFLRSKIWNNKNIEWWYRQNILIFAKEKEIKTHFNNTSIADPKSLTRIHPELFLKRAKKANP